MKTLNTVAGNTLLNKFEGHAPLKHQHSVEVVAIVEKLISHINVTSEEQHSILETALFHNIGWSQFTAEFCAYTGKYTKEEIQLMLTYPQLGAKVLEENGFSTSVIEGVRQHAQAFSSKQPIEARIVRFARDFRKVLEIFPTMELALADMKNGVEKGVYCSEVYIAATKAFN